MRWLRSCPQAGLQGSALLGKPPKRPDKWSEHQQAVKTGLCRAQQMGGLRTGIRPVHIVATSKMVCDYSGMMVQPHKVRCMRQARCSQSALKAPATSAAQQPRVCCQRSERSDS